MTGRRYRLDLWIAVALLAVFIVIPLVTAVLGPLVRSGDPQAAERTRTMRAIRQILPVAQLPELPGSAKILNDSAEAMFLGFRVEFAFEAPLNAIREWIRNGKEVSLSEEFNDQLTKACILK